MSSPLTPNSRRTDAKSFTFIAKIFPIKPFLRAASPNKILIASDQEFMSATIGVQYSEEDTPEGLHADQIYVYSSPLLSAQNLIDNTVLLTWERDNWLDYAASVSAETYESTMEAARVLEQMRSAPSVILTPRG
jgi:hypothetical protein